MARRHPVGRWLAIGVLGSLLVVVLAIGLGLVSDVPQRVSFGSTVGVVELRGPIEDATDLIETLERFRMRQSTVAVVLRVDSPGGAVAPSQELYDEVWRVREQKPVIASLGNVAASGGYYVASAANAIVASPGTITGSIGAIMSLPYMGPLAEKVGIREEIVKSGPYKDIGHPTRPLAGEDRALLQGMVDDVREQFVAAVARGRAMDAERVRALADGRIFSGAQAEAAGLVDHLGGLEAAVRMAWVQAGQSGEPRVWRVRGRRSPWWVRFLSETFAADSHHTTGLLFLYRGPLLE
jgi:protease-4